MKTLRPINRKMEEKMARQLTQTTLFFSEKNVYVYIIHCLTSTYIYIILKLCINFVLLIMFYRLYLNSSFPVDSTASLLGNK